MRISYEIFICSREAYELNEAALLLEEQVCGRILDFDRKTPNGRYNTKAKTWMNGNW